MEAIRELLKLDFTAFILTIFVIMSGIIAGYNIIGKFFELIGKPLKWFKGKNADHDAIIRLEGKMEEYAENRIKDRQQSFEIQKKLVDAQTKISDSVQGLVDKFDEFKADTNNRFEASEEKENKRVRAELKNSISGLYRHYHALGKISDIDLETLEELIEEYEAAGGENSFVHSLVQREMYTWEVIKRKLPDEI